MTREEVARILHPDTSREALRPYDYDPERRIHVVEEACRLAAEALHPVSRDRIERATWISSTDNGCPMYECSACGARDTKDPYEYENPRLFCYRCGRPMTDEAVDIIRQRLEVMKNGNSAG